MDDMAAAGRKYPWAPIAGFILFALIALFALDGFSDGVDHYLFLKLAEWARSSNGVMWCLTGLSTLAEPKFRMPGAVLLALAMLLARRPRAALFVAVATTGGASLCSWVKMLAARARPDLPPRLDRFDSYSFPSGHAWNGMIFFGETALVIAMFLPRRWRVPVVGIGVLLAFLTGLARIALGVHWPTDVLAGWIGGGSWLLLCYGALLGRRDANGEDDRRRTADGTAR